MRPDTLVGVNGFYDTSHLGGTWYSSGGLGLEMAALIGGNDAIDLTFNWYGKLFNSTVIANAFRYEPSNFDFQAGYSHELWNGGPDLRLSATGYKFDIGQSVWGWNAGAELKTRDNMFVLKYAVGNDKVDRTYQTIGGFINVGFQLENLFSGQSPFTKPEPIFNSPRNLRYLLTQKVERNWHQPTAVVVTRQGQGGCGNLDRFLASIPTHDMGNGVVEGDDSFSPVPYTCLDPNKSIVVEFDYVYGGLQPGNNSLIVTIGDSSFAVVNTSSVALPPLPQSGHLSFTLNTFGLRQSAFTATATNPSAIRIRNYGGDPVSFTLTITNVAIHFNQ